MASSTDEAVPECWCGRIFETWAGLASHMRQKRCQRVTEHLDQQELPSRDEAKRARAAAEDTEMHAKMQRLLDEFARDRKKAAALELAQFRYVKMIAGSNVDAFKSTHTKLNASAYATAEEQITLMLASLVPSHVLTKVLNIMQRSYDVYEGIRTEQQELAVLNTILKVPRYHERALPNAKGCIYDFELDQQLLLVLESSESARAQVYETLASWRVNGPSTRENPDKIIFDIPDGVAFEDHPVFGMANRVDAEQARDQQPFASLQWALIMYGDAFCVRAMHHLSLPLSLSPPLSRTLSLPHAHHSNAHATRHSNAHATRPRRTPRRTPRNTHATRPTRPSSRCRSLHVTRSSACTKRAQPINQLSGNSNEHNILAILYAIINLHPANRMSAPALQLASVCNNHDAKAAGMYEVINGGTTSLGAQLTKWRVERPVPDPFGLMATRPMSIHAVIASGDFPAMADMLPFKGSVSANQYDRKSTIDQRSEKYEEPFSLWQVGDDPEAFRRRTKKDIEDVLKEAALEHRKTYRESMLTNVGMNAESFIFHENGDVEPRFALAGIPDLDYLFANSHDEMHSSLQGPVPLEIGLQQFVFIRVRKYYDRSDLNSAKREYKLPPGVTLPDFGLYIEEGRAGPLPDYNGRVKFTAAQSRVWLEHGTSIMELIFKKKVSHCPALRRRHERAAQTLPRNAHESAPR
jgi:hypothetical protein